ncbi:MAG: prepilin peptidase [Gemmatimonadetes bacterium]|nr:A24 family peptidase [Gemmatimonadota bacterium]NNM07446.1 prepilin peptidase [Gemmatimonadota bacterium]
MFSLATLQLLALSIILIAAVVTDIRERRIPNKITVPGLLIGLAIAAAMRGGFPVGALLGALLALMVSAPLFALGGIGAGDAKLLTAVGAFVGPGGLFSVFLYGALAGGVLAIVTTAWRGALGSVFRNLKNLLLYLITLGRYGERLRVDSPGALTVPYGLAIAIGALVTWFFPFSLGGSI